MEQDGRIKKEQSSKRQKMIAVGFEPTPFRTSALSWRLRPLGQATECMEMRARTRAYM
jgi:hypothetical protein